QKAGELDRALEALTVALTLNPHRPALLSQRAELLETLDRPLDALDDHERVYAQDPSHVEALCAALARAANITDGDTRRGLRKRLVVVYEECGRFDAALEILESSLAEDPEDRETLWRLARLGRRDHQLEQASGYY